MSHELILQTRRCPKITWKDRLGEHELLAQRRLVVGASDSADIVVIDQTVSRVHALLEPTERGLIVRDLDSRNGTFVEGVRISEIVLDVSTEILLANLRLHIDFEAGVVAPVELWPEDHFHKLVGRSASMRELFALIARVAPTDASVLIQGETGTGKELVARSIHDASKRASGPYLVVDCGALPENLLDAELFGHAKGAFTGALNVRAGAIESANGGTVFLDEIGELPVAMQPKLLRVLEQRTVRRLGESEHRPVDIRFVTATHRNLLSMVSHGQFREDLYFRLCVIPITVPPLRERREDIELLARHFLKNSAPLSDLFIADLVKDTWRGNVRELRNYMDRVSALGEAVARPSMLDRRFDEEPGTKRRAHGRRDTMAPSNDENLAALADDLPSPPRLPSLRRDDEDEREGTSTSTTDRLLRARIEAAATGVMKAARAPVAQNVSGGTLAAKPFVEQSREIFDGPFKTFRERWLELGEIEYLRRMLEKHDRNVAELAREASVDRTYVYRLMRKYKL